MLFLDFANWEFVKDFIGKKLGIFWIKVGLDFGFVKVYNEYNSARIVDKGMKYLLFFVSKNRKENYYE